MPAAGARCNAHLRQGQSSEPRGSSTGKTGFGLSGGFASNGYGERSPGGYSLRVAVLTEGPEPDIGGRS
jgi:hypothetical protein